MRKKLMGLLAALVMLASTFVLPSATIAEAAGTGQIDTVPITFSIPPVVAGEVSAIGASVSSNGCYISSINWHNMYGQPITDQFTFDNATVVITVNASPGYYFSGAVEVRINGEYAPFENHGSNLIISKTFSPVVWAPNIVKHPGSEKVTEGELASFVALASFTTESTWTVIDTEGKHYSLDELGEIFPELIFYTTYSKLNIGNVPMEMNGYKVCCTFTGPGGTIDTGYADIIVEPRTDAQVISDEQATATPEPTPAHVHSYSTERISDAGYHWYPCDCGAAKSKEVHNFVWIQKCEATLTSPGMVQGECCICGYVMKCRTQLDPEIVENLKSEATPAPTPTANPYVEKERKIAEKLDEIFGFLKKDK